MSLKPLVCIILFCTHVNAASDVYGLFMIVKGQVTFQNPNSGLETAKVGSKVFEGAIISSDKDSRAKIVMSDRNVLNLSPESKLIIQKYDSTAGKKNVSLNLDQGKIRVNVEQKYDGNKEKFLLKTPTVVAGVRGTQFMVTYNLETKTSQVVTFKGAVAMTAFNNSGQALNTVVVEKGQTSQAGPNQSAEPPKTLPKEEFKELDKSSSAMALPDNKNDTNKDKSSQTDKKNENNKDAKNDNNKQPEQRKEPKMANNKDLDTDVAKEIRVNPIDGPKNTIIGPPPAAILPPIRPIDFIQDAIQNQNSKTKVIINIK